MAQRWYVVCSDHRIAPEHDETVWTVSRRKSVPGWETDSGCPGYGLTYKQAKELSDAANAAWQNRA